MASNNGNQIPNPTTADLVARQRSLMQQAPTGRPPAANPNIQTSRALDGRPPQPTTQGYSAPTTHTAHGRCRRANQCSQPPAQQFRIRRRFRHGTRRRNGAIACSCSANTSCCSGCGRADSQPFNRRNRLSTLSRRQPASPADRLVTEAHALSTQAQYEADYTQIIETCRRAQASQCSPTTTQFAKNLVAWSLNRRGQLRAESGQEKEAILDFDDAIRNDATCWRALHNRGVLLAQAGQFEMAFDDFSRTIQLNPQFAKAYSNRAALYLVADNLDAALADYHRAIELDADLAVAHRGCGRVCQLLGRVEEAIAHYDASVQLAPNDAYAAACRADLLTDIGRYTEAEAEYERAIEIDPSLSQAHGGSAWLLATCPDNAVRNPELAIERAKTAIEQGGDKDALNFDTLAAAQASAGDFAGAMELGSARRSSSRRPTNAKPIAIGSRSISRPSPTASLRSSEPLSKSATNSNRSSTNIAGTFGLTAHS